MALAFDSPPKIATTPASSAGTSSFMSSSMSSSMSSCTPPFLAAAFVVVKDGLAGLSSEAVVQVCAEFRQQLDAIETKALAGDVTDSRDENAAEKTLNKIDNRKLSASEKKKRSTRAKTIAKNPKLGDDMSKGKLSSEHVDIIADAAEKSDGAALLDEKLLADIAASGVDQARRRVKRWLNERLKAADVNARYERAQRMRNAQLIKPGDGTGIIRVEGDEASIDEMWTQITADANSLYRRDGGRDVPAGKHKRSHDQRMYDSAFERLTGALVSADNATPDTPATSKPVPPKSAKPGRTTSRPLVMVTVTLDKILGLSDTPANQIGVGPIADAVLAKYLEYGSIVGALFDTAGQPLWLGRKIRHANRAQLLALAVRDQGCVCCTAPVNRCEAHHLIPWHAPARGPTDIDKMALLCQRCHHQLHDNNQTLYCDPADGIWKTRPATPEELPHQGSARRRRKKGPGRSG